jgi:hypothetical protein
LLGAMPAEMKQLLDTLLQKNNLTREEACAGVEAIIEGADPCQAAAFLVLLKAKGETGQEVAGMVSAMRNHMIPVSPGVPCVDIVGTGGDGHHTVNFSTAASVVAAACGASVAKHGNRSVSSMCAACTLSHPPYSAPCPALDQQRPHPLRVHRRVRRTLCNPDTPAAPAAPSERLQVRLGRRAGDARCRPCAARRRYRALHQRGGHRLYVCAQLPPRDEAHRPRAQGARSTQTAPPWWRHSSLPWSAGADSPSF